MIEKVAVAIGATPQQLIALQSGGTARAAGEPATEPAAPGDSPVGGRRILLIIGGGIAAYKCLDLIRRLRERGASVRPVMTKAACEFVTPLSVGALAADRVFTELFDREDEQDVGHIRLARESDLIVVAPATADLMAKMATGLANDLASTILLAAGSPVLIAPAMNPHMWNHPATQRNRKTLESDGIHLVGPNRGEMAEAGEAGEGRMAEPLEIVAAAERILDTAPKPLAGKRIVVTSGPTHEPIDPVRYIANRSSGKQGHAIAAALARLGADVRLVSGPVAIPDPAGVSVTHVETARQMKAAVEGLLPADAAIFAAAVADWRAATEADEKMKKEGGKGPSSLPLTENPDILAGIGRHESLRPGLVIGFAAETERLVENGRAKLRRKGADYIVANDVSPDSGIGGTGVMGGDRNRITLLSPDGAEEWPEMSKDQVAERLAGLVAERLGRPFPAAEQSVSGR
ncbi:bifunctional phosphopantothenoylcysteine decarboxylase/phosphopantothenate--cysteine ligase CoaBC [Oricola thermophila]|uniref:Coenzyme A biosynthesis bifunctional protein CoaBC n=2 Tax=Oricola thermophila TaxID=2742145 RepID=A0A6N1VIW0_9HYPH|nr:bifunctional phosphopantothenoylcysteine decarboxylase/phosphopantothenate--cysteine ligase CoaBC [Oricola thermophila]